MSRDFVVAVAGHHQTQGPLEWALLDAFALEEPLAVRHGVQTKLKRARLSDADQQVGQALAVQWGLLRADGQLTAEGREIVLRIARSV